MNRLKELRLLHGKTQAQVANWLSITQAAYSKYECDRAEPSIDTLSILCKKYNVSLNYILGKEEIKNPTNVYDVDGLLSFQVLGTVRAGYNGTIQEIGTGETIEIPSSMISGGHKNEYFVLQVKGMSMYPRLLDGDKILCKRTEMVDSGRLAVVLYDGEEATVKKLNYVQGEDWVELIPFNPEYATRRINGSNLNEFRILGEVIKLIRDV